MTIRTFIENHPKAALSLFTPDGYVTLSPEQAAELLGDKIVRMNPGSPGRDDEWEIPAEIVLDQVICQVGECTNGIYHFMTVPPHNRELSLESDASPKVRLQARLEDNFEEYTAELHLLSTDELIKRAEETAAVNQMYDGLKKAHLRTSQVEFLLKQDNPLSILADQWREYSEVDTSHMVGHMADLAAISLPNDFDEETEQDDEQSQLGMNM